MNFVDTMPRPIPVRRVRPRTRAADVLTAVERRALWGILGFLAGLAALGPVAALGAAALGALAARSADPR